MPGDDQTELPRDLATTTLYSTTSIRLRVCAIMIRKSVYIIVLHLLLLRLIADAAIVAGGSDPCDIGSLPDPRTLRPDRLTVLISGYSERRLPLLRSLAALYSSLPYVSAVLVLWGNPDTPSQTLSAALPISDGAPISLIRQPERSLNARFLPRTAIRTRAVVVCDDDVDPDPRALALAFSQWLGHDRALVGFFARSHALDLEAKTWIYTLHHDRYSIMLTKLVILKTEYLYRYSCWNRLRDARGLVERERNCEDILMNFVAAMEEGGGEGPVLVEGRVRDWGDPRNNGTLSTLSASGSGEEEEIRRVGLSSRLDHRKRRGWCIREFHRMLGVMPLRYSYGKVVEGAGEQGLCNKGGNLVYCDNQRY
ncbi:hypothetical protein J5N97_022084 [Dioscorea zingiberensis]|uniref:Glycosyl transferase 64 domain-containing protein n=1 Tax=Dioscorea zingiberensis TaxID=325984 RepID=A0A9D5CAT1_9LILI|nr:hypothetical protein J5N97_022084 [Dioscorea zingiberensis]